MAGRLKLPRIQSKVTIGFLILFGLWLALMLTGLGRGFQPLLVVGWVILGFVLMIRGGRWVIRRSIWSLRNRLIVTYLFIALVPIILILGLGSLGAYLTIGQVATYLVSSELERRTASLASPAEELLNAIPGERSEIVRKISPLLQGQLPGTIVLIREGQSITRFPDTAHIDPAEWIDGKGLTVYDGHFCAWARRSGGGKEVVLLAPITAALVASMAGDLGEATILPDKLDPTDPSRGLVIFDDPAQLVEGKSQDEKLKFKAPVERVLSASRKPFPEPYVAPDIPVNGILPLNVSAWGHPRFNSRSFLTVRTRPSLVLGAVFGSSVSTGATGELGGGLMLGFLVLAILLLMVYAVALVIGISLTRSITNAVHKLYAGTEHVRAGDFSHRIQVQGRDQLASLGRSFNAMTEHIEQLVVVAKEKERLQSELEIAREVQGQLFPQSAPKMRTLEISGFCQPARMVSGDYFDYVLSAGGNLGIAIGDVAGKGISAALLMASIQSILRTQLAAIVPARAATFQGDSISAPSAKGIVSVLNRQLHATTAPEKYATFFFGIYDDDRGILKYTNAGHLPPILLRNGTAQELQVTGTVVGAFAAAPYEEETLQLSRGDLLVAYTDGITEPENEYGEEFGMGRLIDALLNYQHLSNSEIAAKVMDAVRQWTAAPEMPDDMTLLLARCTA